MGCCCSSDESNKNDGNKETEMTNKNGNTDTATDDETVLCIARGMSAPTIEIENRTQVKKKRETMY